MGRGTSKAGGGGVKANKSTDLRISTDNLPKLTGVSEKQIQYGEDVRAAFLSALDVDTTISADDVIHSVDIRGNMVDRPNYPKITEYGEKIERTVSMAEKVMSNVPTSKLRGVIPEDEFERDFSAVYNYGFDKRGIGGLSKSAAKKEIERRGREGKALAINVVNKYGKYITDSRDWINRFS